MPSRKQTGEPAVETLTLRRSLYPADVVFGTAFAFLDRCYMLLDQPDKDHWSVTLTPKPGTAIKGSLAGEFGNELVNQAVRLRLGRETEEVRTMIVSRAIGGALPARDARPASKPIVPNLPPEVAKLLEADDDDMDFLDDPLGIAVPWEEKYGKGEKKA